MFVLRSSYARHQAVAFLLSMTVWTIPAPADPLRPPSRWGSNYRNYLPGTLAPGAYGFDLDDTNPGYFGGGRYREYYNYGRGFGIANFPGPYPGPVFRRGYDDVLPPPTHKSVSKDPERLSVGMYVLRPLPAHLVVHVPANAEVFIDDAPTTQRGPMREYATPPLPPDRTFHYEVRAKWKEAGRVVERHQRVEVFSNARVIVDLHAESVGGN
jgi:uncharacterized protein (TIGR03000 family)